MSHFCGVVSWDRPLPSEIRQRLNTLIDPQLKTCPAEGLPPGTFTGFARQTTGGPEKFFGGVRNTAVLFTGTLYNTADLLSLLPEGARGPAANNTPFLIAYLFEKMGRACFCRLNGDFSLGLMDIPQRAFFLLNGKLHPRKVYYLEHKGCLFFSENMESLVKTSGHLPPVESRFLPKYLAYGFVPSPNTLLKGIRRIPPGNCLRSRPKSTRLETYWDIRFESKNNRLGKEKHYSQNVYQVLYRATERRFDPEARTGLFLSGGLDSGSLAAMLKQISPKIPLQTFTAVFREKSFNEASNAQRIADCFSAQHHKILLTPQNALTFVTELTGRLDDPFSDDDVICGGILSPFARQHVDDVFLGDGPDELLMGYPSFLAHRIADLYESVPAVLRKYFEKGMGLLPVSYRYCAFDARFKQFLGGIGYPAVLRDAAWWGPFPPQYQKLLFHDSIQEQLQYEHTAVYREVLDSQIRVKAPSFVERVLTSYIKVLSERWLMKLNAVGEGTPLRFKMPYLDDDFISYVNSIPARYKLKSKYILRKSMHPYLPPRVAHGQKRPFFVPLAAWIKNDFKELIRDTLTAEDIRKAGLQDNAILKMLDAHLAGTANNAKQIWNIFILLSWFKRMAGWGGRLPAREPAP